MLRKCFALSYLQINQPIEIHDIGYRILVMARYRRMSKFDVQNMVGTGEGNFEGGNETLI